METRVQKWGNSLALRIPKPLAVQIGLEPNSPVELSLRGKELIIEPVKPSDLKLDDLLSQVTEHNLHGEVDTGPAKAVKYGEARRVRSTARRCGVMKINHAKSPTV